MHTLLIADDSPHKTMLMQGMLHRKAWAGDILVATTTEEAKKLIDMHNVAYAFIDYYIPSENGPAVIAYLKANNPDAQIALVSSSDKMENFDEAKKAGAQACICTGYPADEVERMFMDIIEEWGQS